MPSLDPAIRDALEARLRFYRELGLTDFYRRVVDTSQSVIAGSENDTLNSVQEKTPIPPRKPMQAAPPIAPEVLHPVDRAAALQLIREEIGDCTRCALHEGRNKIVSATARQRSPDVCGRGPRRG